MPLGGYLMFGSAYYCFRWIEVHAKSRPTITCSGRLGAEPFAHRDYRMTKLDRRYSGLMSSVVSRGCGHRQRFFIVPPSCGIYLIR